MPDLSDFDNLDAWLTPEPESLADLLQLVQERKQPGPNWYKAFPPEQSRQLREAYRRALPSWCQGEAIDGDVVPLRNAAGTLVTRGWTRIVIGDYGAFVEFTPRQAYQEHFSVGSGGEAYNWLWTLDGERTKIYAQLRRVTYADYRPNFFYVAPDFVFPCL